MASIGTDAYDKWLAEYRANVLRQCDNYEIEALELFLGAMTMRDRRDYTIEGIRMKQNHITSMIVRHKTFYYKKMEKKQSLEKWKAFDEVTNLNDDVKQEIHKFYKN